MRALTILALVAALLTAACSGQNDLTGPTGTGSSGSGNGLATTLGVPPASNIGPGAGTGTLPTTPNSCPTLGPKFSVNQNNTKLETWVTSELPGTLRHIEWTLLSNARQVVARDVSEATDRHRGRHIVFYPKNGGVYYIQAQAVYQGCRGGVSEEKTSFNKAEDNPSNPVVIEQTWGPEVIE